MMPLNLSQVSICNKGNVIGVSKVNELKIVLNGLVLQFSQFRKYLKERSKTPRVCICVI